MEEITDVSLNILGQVWYLTILISDLCTLTYFNEFNPLVDKLNFDKMSKYD